ncbi:MAG: hypothetical protein IJ496_01090 [Ruminococcus sp.]|nr:hypothetical protein [Ruminococcus sp.]
MESTIYEGAVIYGYSSSAAQAYAEKYGREFVSLGNAPALTRGDVNGDDIIDISDATAALTIYVQIAASLPIEDYTESQMSTADVNKNGIVEISDATAFLTYYAQNAVGLSPSWDDIVSG